MIPTWLQAVLLGVVQGLTEFIPVSSSGHLVLVPYLLGWEPQGLAFDVALHVGTLVAVVVYFRAELVAIVRGLLGWDRTPTGLAYRRVGVLLVVASVPVAAGGLLLEERIADAFDSPLVVVVTLLVTAALLVTSEAVRDRRVRRAAAPEPVDVTSDGARQWTGDWRAGERAMPPAVGSRLPLGTDPADRLGADLAGLRPRHAVSAGLLQALALLPGISRSGATIAGGVFAGLTREAATRFSFLLSIPALAGASIVSLPDLPDAQVPAVEVALGIAAAFVSGYVAIRYLVALVARDRLTPFAFYCMAVAGLALLGYGMLGPPGTV